MMELIQKSCVLVRSSIGLLAMVSLALGIFLRRKDLSIILSVVRRIFDVDMDVALVLALVLVGMTKAMNVTS